MHFNNFIIFYIAINETDAQLKSCQKQLALMKQDLEKSNNLLAKANQKKEALDK